MMKIAFSMIGCPEWSWAEIVSMASDLGFNGVKIRGLASRAGVTFVRILGDWTPEPSLDDRAVDDEAVVGALATLAAHARYKKVTVLIETNGDFADSARLAGLLIRVDSPAVGVLWDIHQPFRFFREDLQTTWRKIGSRVRYIHVKNFLHKDGKIQYRLLGDGDPPVRSILELLDANGYEGYLCLEWVKRWSRDLEDAAIVFPHFANIIGSYLACLGRPLRENTSENATARSRSSRFASGPSRNST